MESETKWESDGGWLGLRISSLRASATRRDLLMHLGLHLGCGELENWVSRRYAGSNDESEIAAGSGTEQFDRGDRSGSDS